MEDDFDYDDEVFDPAQFDKERLRNTASLQKTTLSVQNMPHDEEVALSESESLMSPDEPPVTRGIPEPSAASQLEASADDYSIGSRSAQSSPQHQYNGSSLQASPSSTQQAVELPSRQGTGTGTAAAAAAGAAGSTDLLGGYNPQNYAKLLVPDDVQDLFKYIGSYKPHVMELPTKLKPFIPDFIPAIGGTDEFIKVPRPDGRPDYLGLKVLDEPAAVQSDPALLNLQLRQLSKDTPGVRMEVVGRINHDDKDKKQRLAAWISSIAEIHKSKPTAAVRYSKPMPDIEALMQEWPPELDAALRSSKLPDASLELDLLSYSKLVCALLDVPVYDNVVESLHLLFSLFLEFKQNPFFRAHVDTEQDHIDQGGMASSRPFSGSSARV